MQQHPINQKLSPSVRDPISAQVQVMNHVSVSQEQAELLDMPVSQLLILNLYDVGSGDAPALDRRVDILVHLGFWLENDFIGLLVFVVLKVLLRASIMSFSGVRSLLL